MITLSQGLMFGEALLMSAALRYPSETYVAQAVTKSVIE
jgi:hypothetical protein